MHTTYAIINKLGDNEFEYVLSPDSERYMFDHVAKAEKQVYTMMKDDPVGCADYAILSVTVSIIPVNMRRKSSLLMHNTSGDHNKFYLMNQVDDDSFLAEWGRIGSPRPQSKSYPMSAWNKIKGTKLGKGYYTVRSSYEHT
ncbi:hypothetical protein [Acinetobacter sp.]|uniref:hypothetical protein n=1 Tax=Acinetobacter sp. TaxID=472 RepID=UPI003D0456EB